MRPAEKAPDPGDPRVVLLREARGSFVLGVDPHRPELEDCEVPSSFAQPRLAVDDRSRGGADQQHEEREQRRREEQARRRDNEVEHALGHTCVRLLAEVQHAHEPRRGQVAEGNAPERVLDEMRDADDPEPNRREVEEWIDGPRADAFVGEDHDVGPVTFDDLLVERPQARDIACGRLASVADEPQHRERGPLAALKLVQNLGSAPAGAHHEHAALRDAADRVLPGRGQREDDHGGLAQGARAGVDSRHPEVEGRDGDEPRERPGRRGDCRTECEVGAQPGAEAQEPDRGHHAGGDERLGHRGGLREQETDRQPDQERASAEDEPGDAVPRGDIGTCARLRPGEAVQPLGLEGARLGAGAHTRPRPRKTRLTPRATNGPGSVMRNHECVTRR